MRMSLFDEAKARLQKKTQSAGTQVNVMRDAKMLKVEQACAPVVEQLLEMLKDTGPKKQPFKTVHYLGEKGKKRTFFMGSRYESGTARFKGHDGYSYEPYAAVIVTDCADVAVTMTDTEEIIVGLPTQHTEYLGKDSWEYTTMEWFNYDQINTDFREAIIKEIMNFISKARTAERRLR
jgi:hypothetical protein